MNTASSSRAALQGARRLLATAAPPPPPVYPQSETTPSSPAGAPSKFQGTGSSAGARGGDGARGGAGGGTRGRTRRPRKPQVPGEYRTETFEFDEESSIGWRRLDQIREAVDLVRKAEAHRPQLNAQAQSFRPPTESIRVTSVFDLSDPDAKICIKRVLLVPIASLPLPTPEAVHRVKLLAGPRYTHGRPGETEMEFERTAGADAGVEEIGREGWIKISEDRFPSARMNRKSCSDMLEKLVEAANDPKSPLPADVPLDLRHLYARQKRRKNQFGQNSHAPSEALKSRVSMARHPRGFPQSWLPDAKTSETSA